MGTDKKTLHRVGGRPGLAELQAMFQSAVTKGGPAADTVIDLIQPSDKADPASRLSVYQTAYVIRLLEFLQNDFPQCWGYVGDDQFETLARAYIAATPSQTPNARWYADRFPAFLARQPLAKDHPEIAELARFERALTNAFDAADAPLVSLTDLQQVTIEHWPQLIFTPHPAAQLLRFNTNAVALWQALKQAEDEATDPQPPAIIHHDEPQHYLVYRYDGQPTFRPLAYDEAMFWTALCDETPFGTLCEMMATYAGEDLAAPRAAEIIQGLIQGGILIHNEDRDNDSE